MNTRTLSLIAKLNKKRASDLARTANVSRAAVSLWMKQPNADVSDRHLFSLAEYLGVSMETLMQPLPLLADTNRVQTIETALLWDRLYASIGDFAIALARREFRAIARLVEVYGMFRAEKIVGRTVWTAFKTYKTRIPPVRRNECERLCRELKSLRLN